MSLTEFPNKPGSGKPSKAELSEVTWARLRSMGAKSKNDFTNVFSPAQHPPGVGPQNAMAQDEAFGQILDWAWTGLEGSIRSGLMPMTFMGFPALANLSQKAEYRRIVETLATEMTRKWIRLTTASEDNKTDKIKQLDAELKRLGVRDAFKKVSEHDGFFGRGHIYLDWGADPGDDDELASSVGSGSDDVSKAKVAQRPLRAIRVVEPVWIYPQDYSSTNALAPDFYRPQSWYVQNRRVHETRLLTFVGRPVSDLLKPAYSFGGVPMTQLAMLYVQNWERIRDSVGRLIEAFSVNGLKTKLAEAANAGDNGINLQRRIDLFNQFRNNLGAFILDTEEEFFNVVTPLGSLDQLQAQAQEHMAAVSGIPLVKLLGLSPHGLNASSEGEIRVFYDWVHAFQEFFLRPHLMTILHFVMMGLWGEIDEEINFLFEPLWSSSELEAAQVQQTEANTDKTYIDAGVMTALEVRRKVANDKEMPYSGLDLAGAPELSEAERSDNATKMATPILQSYEQGLIKPSKTLEELVEAGVFKTVTEEDIQEADNAPPAPNMDPNAGGAPPPDGGGNPSADPAENPKNPPAQGNGPSPGDPSGGGASAGRPAGAPHLRLATSNDRNPFDLGKLSKTESERLRRAIAEGDTATINQILDERETYRGAWEKSDTWAADSRGFVVYHGSPYQIEEFDAEHEGTGTGRAHYGQGLYFAESPAIADWYKRELTSRISLAGKPLHLNAATTHIYGHIYKVYVDRDPADFIDWDRGPDSQQDRVRDALVRVLGQTAIQLARKNGRTTGDLLKFLPAGTSEALGKEGIAGVKYLDRHEEGAGTFNFVVFNPEDAQIVGEEDRTADATRTLFDPDRDNHGEFSRKGTGVARKVQGAPAGREHPNPFANRSGEGSENAYFDPLHQGAGHQQAAAGGQAQAHGQAQAPQGRGPGPQRDWHEQIVEHDDKRISTRVPWTVGQGDIGHKSADLQVGMEALKQNPELMAKNAEFIQKMTGYAHLKGKSPDETIKAFVDQVKGNLLALYNSADINEWRERAKLWYDGGNRIANEWGTHYGLPPEAIGACIAALSPQTDWFKNVSFAHRVIEAVTQHADEPTTQRMQEWGATYLARKEKEAAKLEGQGKQSKADSVRKIAGTVQKALKDAEDKSLSQITDPFERAVWVRAYDETENSRFYPEMTPEGDIMGAAKTNGGLNEIAAWGGFDRISNAIQVIDNPDLKNISMVMGAKHKVRNFYNNIMAPNNDKGDVTIDTHAIGAGNLMPWGSSAPEVDAGLGGRGGSAGEQGLNGLYAIYAEAYRQAAADAHVLPRQMQSVTWEAQRALFPEDAKGKKLTKEIKGIWEQVDAGKLDADGARKAILARGIGKPSWHKSRGRVDAPKGDTADAGELHSRELVDRGLGLRAHGGGRSGDAGAVSAEGGRRAAADGDLAADLAPHETFHDPAGKFTAREKAVPKRGQVAAPPKHHIQFHPVDPRERQPAQLSWESAPGKTTQHMPEFHDAPLEQRREYQKEIEKTLTDEQGHDRIAKALGLRTGPTFSAAGVFQGRVNPGAQGQVDVGRVTDHDKQLINAGEAIRGMLLRQDAAAWHKPETPPNHRYLIPGLKTSTGAVFPEDHGEALTHADAYKAMTPEAQQAFLKSGRDNQDNYIFKNDKGQILNRRAARKYAEKEGLLSEIGKAYNQPDLIAEHVDPAASTRFVDTAPADANMIDFKVGRPLSETEAQAFDSALGQIEGMEHALVPTPQGFRVLNTGSMPNEQFHGLVHDAIEGVDAPSLPDNIDATREHYTGDYISNDWSKSPNGEDYLQAIGQAGPDVQRSADTLLASLGPQIEDVEKRFSEKYGWKRDESHTPWSKGPAQDLLNRNGGAPTDEQIPAAAENIIAKHGTAENIARVREQLKGVVPTNEHVSKGGHTLDDGSYTPEREKLHRDILGKLFTPETIQAATPAPGQKPTMSILGGRGGSGKSFLTSDKGPISRKNTIIVDSDAFKQQLPEYQGWNAAQVHEESSHIADMAAETAKHLGVNVAFDQTMRSGNSAPRRLEQFKDSHNVHGYYMHTTPEVAADRAMGRFARGSASTTPGKTGRFVPPELVLGSHNNEKNFDAITHSLDKWELYDNNGEKGEPKKVAEGKNHRGH